MFLTIDDKAINYHIKTLQLFTFFQASGTTYLQGWTKNNYASFERIPFHIRKLWKSAEGAKGNLPQNINRSKGIGILTFIMNFKKSNNLSNINLHKFFYNHCCNAILQNWKRFYIHIKKWYAPTEIFLMLALSNC